MTTIAATMLGWDFNDELRLYITPTTILFIFTKFYDWLRLFEILSIWTQLIEQAIIDIFPFLIVFWLCIYGIGIPIAILDMERDL